MAPEVPDWQYREYCEFTRHHGDEPLDREGYEQMVDDMGTLG